MPAHGPLLCNFNQVFKLDPVMFDLWLNITASAPGSSLVRAPTLNLNNAFAY
jgi:predicted O-linked N-acetylglucosamine transferase (SPINDLY family)